jgi:hypothetical protein
MNGNDPHGIVMRRQSVPVAAIHTLRNFGRERFRSDACRVQQCTRKGFSNMKDAVIARSDGGSATTLSRDYE